MLPIEYKFEFQDMYKIKVYALLLFYALLKIMLYQKFKQKMYNFGFNKNVLDS